VEGDSHVPEIQVLRDTLVINPGSPMYPRNMNVSLGNIGFLRLADGTAEAWVEPLHPEDGPTLRDGDVLDHREAADRHPDQWLLFAVHGHDPVSGLSRGSVMHTGFEPEQAPALERSVRRRDPSAILLAFHTASPPERGAAQLIRRPAHGTASL
jgi:hypothetical protein